MIKIFIFLLGLSSLTALSGCLDDQYSIERQYWKAQKQAEKVFKNPDTSPPRELEEVVSLQNKFIQKYPGNILAIQADFNIVRLYLAKKEYEKARGHAKNLLSKYSKYESVCADAAFLQGYAYELENEWDTALSHYKKIIEIYPRTVKGLEMPIYIARYYKTKYQPEKMIATYKEAANHYNELAQKHPKTPFGYTVNVLGAKCYMAIKDWDSAVEKFNTIIETYKDKIKMDPLLLNTAMLYSKQLKDNASAKAALERLIKEYPQSRFIKVADRLLKGIEETK
jgi:tetratricopeptide (TPR) repeat protein